jgi:spore germination protein YaaH
LNAQCRTRPATFSVSRRQKLQLELGASIVALLAKLMSLLRIAGIALALLFVIVQADEETDGAVVGRQHPRLPVLGYVTPWNGGGKQLVEDHRERFDIVCPVWYTVHPSADATEVYSVRGGPPEDGDSDWYERLQHPSAPSTTSEPPKPLQVFPRFILDGWSQDDYRRLLFNKTRWAALSKTIIGVVEEMSFDGVVFESGATHALAGPLSSLSDGLHDHDKQLILVSPPIRTSSEAGESTGGLDAHSSAILESLPSLTALADYITIMTYDMNGPAGQQCKAPFPANSPAGAAQKEGNVREPGPNTSAEWVRANLAAFSGGLGGTMDELDEQQILYRPDVSTKLLMGLPLYGYTYPIMYIDVKKGAVEREKKAKQGDAVGILRGAGKPITVLEIDRLLEADVHELQGTEDGEFYLDYKDDDGDWRVFLPTQQSMSNVLDVIEGASTLSGVALWEVGQSSAELLSVL